MKSSVTILCLGVLAVGYVYAQRFPTNYVSQAQAVKIASGLWIGMSEEDVVNVVDKQNGLTSGGSVGVGPASSWTRFYLLSNGCFLDLEIEPKQERSNRWLSAASIQSNGVKIVSIVLTNAHLLPLATFADEVRIAVGMSRDDTVALIKKHSGTDITPGLAVVGPKGEHPLTGIYWEFQDYDAIITLVTKDGKVTGMTFWTKKDFGENKSHRDKTEQSIMVLRIDTKKKEVSIEKKKDAG